ncbi:hypothetical protein ACFOWZ_13705 [Lentzea rhizosphaerae]|uniref:Uncharacterized protein n=1 Tax=Lentzea rhizosphaerae TaxID=2041025 RepID=A0ABV8BQM7_9PSEU
MGLTSLGIGIALTVAIPALVLMVVSLIALRGTDPSQRPEIIRALADLISAARRGRGPSPRTSRAKSLPATHDHQAGSGHDPSS